MTGSAKDGIARDPTVLDGRSSAGAASDDAADVLPAGYAAGEYVVERRLGGGAMGDVYAGRHPVIGKKVAIKVLKRELAGRAESAERFLREARAVNQIDHPNVVDVFAIGRLDDGRLYLVMDLLDGCSLRERLAEGAMSPDVALAVLGQIASALDAAHARGVIHRDLKPDNIVLTGPAARPTAHVLDFGIAKLLADAAGERVLETLTGQGAWLGTPAYMAPEQWSADGATAASDRYALGIVAFEMLTGRPPFAATTLPGMMEQHFRAAVPSVTSTGAALHPSLDRAFARALAKEPGERPESAAALVGELEAALGGKLRVTAGGRSRGGRGAWVAGAAGLAVAIAGGVIVIGGFGRERARSEAALAQAPAPAPPAANVARVEVMSTPPGARVKRGAADLGVTPLFVDVERGTRVELQLSKPGCVPARLEIGDAPALVNANLALVTGFEGVWSLPDGTLREFERRGEQVAGFELGTAQGPRSFLRMFEFVPTDGTGVAFAATEQHVDERAPDEPSCHIPLRAEYRYQPATDTLELRREKAQYALDSGRCVMQAMAWGEARRLARIAGAPDDAMWAESRAGGAAPQAPQVDPDRKDPLEQKTVNDAEQKLKPPPGKKRPPAKNAVPAPAPPDEPANEPAAPNVEPDPPQQQAPNPAPQQKSPAPPVKGAALDNNDKQMHQNAQAQAPLRK